MTIFFKLWKLLQFTTVLLILTAGLSYLNFFGFVYMAATIGYILATFIILPLIVCQALIVMEHVKKLDRKLSL